MQKETSQSPLLSLQNFNARYFNDQENFIQNLSFDIYSGETFALVGESGSGKSLTASCITRLRQDVICSGAILFQGEDILKMQSKELQALRHQGISYIFQEPSISLDPSFTIGYHITECGHSKSVALDWLRHVGFSDPSKVYKSYPHELSGGMQQRAMIGIALANNPRLLIADEPTTSLDVVLQQQILELIQSLQKEQNFSILLISHDFAVVSKLAQQVGVLQYGKCVEKGPVKSVLRSPQHPYTQNLIESILCVPY